MTSSLRANATWTATNSAPSSPRTSRGGSASTATSSSSSTASTRASTRPARARRRSSPTRISAASPCSSPGPRAANCSAMCPTRRAPPPRATRCRRCCTTSARRPDVGKIQIIAHSMGGWLTMEALRASAIGGDRDLSGHLDNVILASPDIDMTVFASQMARIRPAKVTVFATPTTGRCRFRASSRARGRGSARSTPRSPRTGPRSKASAPRWSTSPPMPTPTASSAMRSTRTRRRS